MDALVGRLVDQPGGRCVVDRGDHDGLRAVIDCVLDQRILILPGFLVCRPLKRVVQIIFAGGGLHAGLDGFPKGRAGGFGDYGDIGLLRLHAAGRDGTAGQQEQQRADGADQITDFHAHSPQTAAGG